MVIDYRNIAEIHAMGFFSEVAAYSASRKKKKTLAEATGRSVGGKYRKKKATKKRIFHLSLERLRLRHILTRSRKTPCLSHLSEGDFSEAARCPEGCTS
ncbi:hypothetical protein CDAR_404431 [Caerostris darwini]|uniref:Uncharacterized protein n=1 Tax=Caerostris darwini TaxID=1538125 RepID=A0AAV4STU7_9ARAC|nr:hypothetical protein CDAR_404431 [Caerostris darwini]